MKLLCPAPCNTTFELDLPMPMPISLWCAKLKDARCPKCHGRAHIKIVTEPMKQGTYGL